MPEQKKNKRLLISVMLILNSAGLFAQQTFNTLLNFRRLIPVVIMPLG